MTARRKGVFSLSSSYRTSTSFLVGIGLCIAVQKTQAINVPHVYVGHCSIFEFFHCLTVSRNVLLERSLLKKRCHFY